VFAIPPTGSSREPAERLIRHVGRVVKEGLGGWQWDGVGLAVGMAGDAEGNGEWEDVCAEMGLEFVLVGGGNEGGRNEFGGEFRSFLSSLLSISFKS